jgi:hypothetical protein
MAKSTPRKKAIDLLQKLVKLKAADDNGYVECWSCGSVHHWSEMDGGHFIAKGASSYWATEEENVHPQCRACNRFGMKFGTATQNYTLKMEDFYGRDFVEAMLKDKLKVRKIYKYQYLEMIDDLNEQIKFHLERVGG